jgi:hypothetical protein
VGSSDFPRSRHVRDGESDGGVSGIAVPSVKSQDLRSLRFIFFAVESHLPSMTSFFLSQSDKSDASPSVGFFSVIQTSLPHAAGFDDPDLIGGYNWSRRRVSRYPHHPSAASLFYLRHQR